MMTDKIQQDLIGAMKSAEKLRVSVLRMLLSEINYKKIDLGRELTDEDIAGVVRKEVKKRREAIESFTAGGRTEQADSEKAEMVILETYIPIQMTEAEVRSEVQMQLQKIAEPDRKIFGNVMRIISPLFRGKADGGMVAKIVKESI